MSGAAAAILHEDAAAAGEQQEDHQRRRVVAQPHPLPEKDLSAYGGELHVHGQAGGPRISLILALDTDGRIWFSLT